MLKYVTPPWASPSSPTPNSKTCVISVNYEPISTKFSGMIPLTRRKRLLKKIFISPPLGAALAPQYYKIPDICGSYE